MSKVGFMYIILLVNLVIMFLAIRKIYQKRDYEKIKKLTFLYLTLIIPILGFILISLDKGKRPEIN